jgi:hypothetical protein
MIVRNGSWFRVSKKRPHEIEKMATMLKIPGKVFMVA